MSRRISSLLGPLVLALLGTATSVGCGSSPPDGELERSAQAAVTDLDTIASSDMFSPRLTFAASAKIDTTEDAALALAINQLGKLDRRGRVSRLEDHLTKFPASRWAPSLRLALGEQYLRDGRIGLGVQRLQAAFDAARVAGLRHVADSAAARLLEVHAWLGNASQVQSLMKTLQGGPYDRAAVAAQRAGRALVAMSTDPNAVFRCGQYALSKMPGAEAPKAQAQIDASKSSASGTSLVDLESIAASAGLAMQMVKAPSGVVPVPSIAHFASGHWAAITDTSTLDGGAAYRIVDPSPLAAALMGDVEMSAEADGYFLVPTSVPLPKGAVVIDAAEGAKVWGRGGVAGPHDGAAQRELTTSSDACSRGPCTGNNTGMAGYGFNRYSASLSIWDSPTGYVPENGESVQITATYDDLSSRAVETAPGFGPHWRANWMSWVEIDPSGNAARVFLREGGFQDFRVLDPTPGARVYARGLLDQTELREDASGRFVRTLADGSTEVFGHVVGAGVGRPSYAMLSERIDRSGNTIRLGYDGRHRLVSLTDAMNRVTTIEYSSAAGGMHIRAITDPFGRVARFQYVDPDNGFDPEALAALSTGRSDDWVALALRNSENARLTAITDVVGLTSRFTYRCGPSVAVSPSASIVDAVPTCSTDASGRAGAIPAGMNDASESFIIQLETPYGRTRFRTLDLTDASGGLIRHATAAIDPLGMVERTDSYLGPSGDPSYVAEPLPNPVDPTNPLVEGAGHLHFRNVYGWNKRAGEALGRPAMADLSVTSLDRNRATIYHYLHDQISSTGPVFAAPVLSSIKRPLEGRTFFAYQGQTTPEFFRRSESELATVKPWPTAMVRPLGGGRLERVSLTYNAQGQPLTGVDALGRRTVVEYEPNGIDVRRISAVNAAGTLVTLAAYTYDSRRLPISVTDDAGVITRFTWDASGRVATVTDAAGRVTTITRTPIVPGLPSATAPTTGEKTVIADPAGGFRTVSTFAGSVSEIVSNGHSANVSSDALGRPVVISDEAGSKYTFAYDRLNLSTVYDPNGARTSYAFDALGRVTSITNPAGGVVAFAFEPDGSIGAMTDANGRITRWTYDSAGHPTGKRLPGADRATVMVLDPITATPTSVTDPRGTTTTMTYNLDGTLASRTTGSETVSWLYDAALPRLSSMSDATGTTTYAYPVNAPLRVQRATSAAGTLDLLVDGLGRASGWRAFGAEESLVREATTDRITGTAGDGLPETYAYAGTNGRLSAVRIPRLGVATDVTWGSGLDHGNLTAIRHTAGSTVSLGMTYDWFGRLSSGTQSSIGTDRYTYDVLGRLVGSQLTTSAGALQPAIAHAYDRMGNRTSVTTGGATTASFTYESTADKLVTANLSGVTTAVGYDANGNVTSIGADTYTWDGSNRLEQIQYGGAATGNSTTFAYDGEGRVARITERTAGAVTSDLRYLWIGDQPITESNAVTGAVRRVFYSHAVRGADGVLRAQLRDTRNSVIALTDGSGRITQQATYDAFGNVTSGGVTGDANPFGYAGYFVHARSGLAMTPNRFYAPRLGRWLSRDPIGEAGGLNLYAYVGNDPMNAIDPSGLSPWYSDADGVANAIAGTVDGILLGLPIAKGISNWANGDGTIGGCDRASTYRNATMFGGVVGMAVSAPGLAVRFAAAARSIAAVRAARGGALATEFAAALRAGGSEAVRANRVLGPELSAMKGVAQAGISGARNLIAELSAHSTQRLAATGVPALRLFPGWAGRYFLIEVGVASGRSQAVLERVASWADL